MAEEEKVYCIKIICRWTFMPSCRAVSWICLPIFAHWWDAFLPRSWALQCNVCAEYLLGLTVWHCATTWPFKHWYSCYGQIFWEPDFRVQYVCRISAGLDGPTLQPHGHLINDILAMANYCLAAPKGFEIGQNRKIFADDKLDLWNGYFTI